MVRGFKDHPDVQQIVLFMTIGTGLLIGIFSHGARDPRYYFGGNRNQDAWKKYMSKRQWCQSTGLGLRLHESSNDNNINTSCGTTWMKQENYIGLKMIGKRICTLCCWIFTRLTQRIMLVQLLL